MTTFYEINEYIFNEITKEDVIENEIDQMLLEQHDCGYEGGKGEDGCNSLIHNK